MRVCAGVSVTTDPAYSRTVTLALSPAAVPAVPLSVGVTVLTVLPLAGAVTVGAGAVVSTGVLDALMVKVWGTLVPVVPASCETCTV